MDLSKNEMKTILDAIQDFIVIISPEKEIVEVNDTFLKQMKYERDEVIGRQCSEVFQQIKDKSSNCLEKCPLERVIREKNYCQEELIRYDKNKNPRYTELTIFPVWEKPGKISKFIEISRDITQRKLDEKESHQHLVKMVEERTHQLKETHERLLHQDKMASLGKLSSCVVHEINNPVAGILNMVKLSQRILKEDKNSKDSIELIQQYLGLMETETRRIGRIVSNLLTFARHSEIEVIKFDINELIDQTLILNSNLLKINKIRVIENLEHNLPLIKGSEDQMKQVIMNLISNAVESMRQTSKKRLTIKTVSQPEDQSVGIQIQDTGSGIPKESISKIFEPFFTTKKKGKGVGLGLSVVYGIINEHGGKLFVDSTPGKGSRFDITLYQELPPKKKDPAISNVL